MVSVSVLRNRLVHKAATMWRQGL